ncbi:uncharacterized protein LOC125854596 [Solanum stenotomum]|uniref:uncharacterized protein LOC125854596 n=1 Tax=Solanum stenotomum TaxID=172797 RepID=UPI0020D01D70|nr:uncharacterized protein LOC125854596 [Solanum stenotomum]
MTDVTIVEKILRSLTLKYDYVVCSIEESKNIDKLSLDEFQSSLLVHKQKMNRSSSSEEQALKSECYARLPNDKYKKSNFVQSNEVETLLMAVQVEKELEQNVCFGDSSTVSAIGKDDIKIRTKNGFEETISNVLYVTTLKSNLLSVVLAENREYSPLFESRNKRSVMVVAF